FMATRTRVFTSHMLRVSLSTRRTGNQLLTCAHQRSGETVNGEQMFRIKASYADQMELRTTLEKAREFFGELRNFADLMPGIEGIRKEAGGIMRWVVRAEVPIIGAVHAAFTVEKTEDSPERLEWSPARSEMKNYLRYAAVFEERGHKVLIKIAQHVELRRQHAK